MVFPKTLALVLALAHCVAAGPALEKVLQMAVNEPDELVQMLHDSPLAAIAEFADGEEVLANASDAALAADGVPPLVFAHGMGDSCFNSGMKQITSESAAHVGGYGTCIPNADSRIKDTLNGFLMNMDKAVEDWATRVRADPKLKDGFVAVGFSQGNSLIRGYIQRFNDPPVLAHVSVHGTVSGVAGFPQCNPAGGILGPICSVFAEVLGTLAYNDIVQGILFQADYLRVPTKVTGDAYLKHSQIAGWNNEGAVNSTYKDNFGKTQQHLLVKALKDTMVFPNEGEWYGTFEDGAYKTVLPMNETRMYKEDLFGLKTADEAGKFMYETTAGNHLDFTSAELYSWLDRLDVFTK